MTRFFVRPDQIVRGEVTLDADDAHHLRTVLKSQAGDKIAVLDGLGHEYKITLTEVGKSQARGRVTAEQATATECAVRITVAQALPKMSDKMEQVLQRGTEVGAAAFWAFSSARSLTHLTAERHAKRLVRWQTIVKTAAEQSHRAILPTVRADQTLDDVIKEAGGFDVALFAYEGETGRTLRVALETTPDPLLRGEESLPSKPSSVLVIVGPEGGFTDEEVKAARRAGLLTVSLGPRILRTETAALVMLSQIVYALE